MSNHDLPYKDGQNHFPETQVSYIYPHDLRKQMEKTNDKVLSKRPAEQSNVLNRQFSTLQYSLDYSNTVIHKKGDIIKNIEVPKATKETKNLNIVISGDIKAIHNIKINAKEIEPEVDLIDNIIAPISKGQELGTIKYTVDGLEYNAKLLAENDVIKKTYYVEILIGVGVFAFIVVVIIIIKKKSKK